MKYTVQTTSNAHAWNWQVPERCWLNATRHRTLKGAEKSAAKRRHDAYRDGARHYNVRIVDEEGRDLANLPPSPEERAAIAAQQVEWNGES